MGYLEPRKTNKGISWRYVYRWNGNYKRITIGVTTRKVALKRQVAFQDFEALGIDPASQTIKHEESTISIAKYSEKDAQWCASRMQPKTIELTEHALSVFGGWFGDNRPISAISRYDVEKFINYCRDTLNHGPTTINLNLRTLRASFQRSIDEHGILTTNPFHGVKPLAVPKRARSRPQYLTRGQIRLLVMITRDKPWLNRLIRFYLATGARRNEALELTWGDIDWEHQEIWLGNPNSRTKLRRPFPISTKLEKLLKEVATDRNPDSDRVFWYYSPKADQINKRFVAVRKHKNLPDDLSPHTLRHTFASHALLAGIDVKTVADWLGHSLVSTTELYGHLIPSHAREQIRKHPVEGILRG
ncbi:tyrosine-type recombinase/integrase [bacterium]|nr:tyrosine-type recombinase/integrase [bacterium]